MHSVSKNLQRDEEPGERDPKQRPLQGAFLIPPVLPVVLIFSGAIRSHLLDLVRCVTQGGLPTTFISTSPGLNITPDCSAIDLP